MSNCPTRKERRGRMSSREGFHSRFSSAPSRKALFTVLLAVTLFYWSTAYFNASHDQVQVHDASSDHAHPAQDRAVTGHTAGRSAGVSLHNVSGPLSRYRHRLTVPYPPPPNSISQVQSHGHSTFQALYPRRLESLLCILRSQQIRRTSLACWLSSIPLSSILYTQKVSPGT